MFTAFDVIIITKFVVKKLTLNTIARHECQILECEFWTRLLVVLFQRPAKFDSFIVAKPRVEPI